MGKLAILVVVLLLSVANLLAGEGDYAVSRISPALLKNANVIVRLEQTRFEINNTKDARLKNHYVITILNENGAEWADFEEYYNRFREVESVEAILYDANGKQLKRIKKKDLEDRSGLSGSNLIDDNRIKHHNFYYKVYPYTVEYIVDISYKSTLFFPRWTPQGSEKLSVESSSMSIVCPTGYQFRYKSFNYDKDPVVTLEKNNSVSTWSASNLNAITREPYGPMWHELATMVIFGPTEFQVDEYRGNMATWQDFGKFVFTLKQGRDQLPDNIKQTVHQLSNGVSDPHLKIARLYEFMQANTRYISIQLGIGGWQPFDAKEVATKGYGDCKALTNYMYSLLKEAGILSYYVLVRAGRSANYITADFPSQQFNHVILCVPLSKQDSVWLECTSQSMPAGYLGDFTSDRNALLIDEHGGKLVRTPKYGIDENVQARNIKAKLDDNGSLYVNAATTYTGMQQDNLHEMIHHLSKEKVKEYLHEQLDFSTYDITQFDYKEAKGLPPAINELLNITVSNYAAITGKRIFILPNMMTRSVRKLSQDSTRKYDIQLTYEYRDIDTIEIEISGGYELEAVPEPVKVTSKFGSYSSTVQLKDHKLYYFRWMEQNSGRFPAKDYTDLVKFYEAIYKADRSKVVLVRKEEEKKAF